jgi:hypothetical protein
LSNKFAEVEEVCCLDVVLSWLRWGRGGKCGRNWCEKRYGCERMNDHGSPEGVDTSIALRSQWLSWRFQPHPFAFQDLIAPDQLCIDSAFDVNRGGRIDSELGMVRLKEILTGYRER